MSESVMTLKLHLRRVRRRVEHFFSKLGFREEYFLTVMAIVIGVATGFGASGFYYLIEKANELAYGHGAEVGGLYGGRVLMLVLLPSVGALIVGFMTYYLAREAKGHGVPEVMDAIYRHDGVIRPRVAIVKAVASALTIGSGGSAGTEGPIIQIGAALGSGVGQFMKVHRRQMAVLVACGAAAGIASIFNAPIAGVLFALEIFLRDFSFRAFSPVVFASVLSCSTTHYLQSKFAESGAEVDRAIFSVERVGYEFIGTELFYYLMLGAMCAVVGVAFISLLYWSEDVFDKMKLYAPFKPVCGAIGLGLTGAAYCLITQNHVQPAFFGNGYPMIEVAVSEQLLTEFVGYAGIGVLLAFLALKMAATCLTLGSGGSGGVFAPSLFMGAAMGGAFGLLLKQLGLVEDVSVSAYALVGMAALVAATTHASLTAIIILFEMTRDYKVILPVMFAAIVATAGAKMLLRDSIYTLKLRRRGVQLGTLADQTILRRLTADQVQTLKPQLVRADEPLQRLIDLAGHSETADFVVLDEQDEYMGMVMSQDIRTALLQPEAVPLLLVGELLRPEVPLVSPQETLDSVLDKFSRSDCAALPITGRRGSDEIVGLITRQGVMALYREALNQEPG